MKIYEIVRWLLPRGHHLPSTFGSMKGKSGTRIFRVAARKFQVSKYSDYPGTFAETEKKVYERELEIGKQMPALANPGLCG